jgi:hypothetical protein
LLPAGGQVQRRGIHKRKRFAPQTDVAPSAVHLQPNPEPPRCHCLMRTWALLPALATVWGASFFFNVLSLPARCAAPAGCAASVPGSG